MYCDNFVMIGQTADAGDNLKNRATIPLASCRGPPYYSLFLVRNQKNIKHKIFFNLLFTYNNISVRLDLAPDDTDDVAALLVLQVVVHHQSHLPVPLIILDTRCKADHGLKTDHHRASIVPIIVAF